MSLEQEQPQNELKQPEQPEQPEHKNPEPELENLENLENLEHKNLEHENPEYESSSTKATKTAKIYPDKQFKIVHVVYDSPFKVFNQVRNWFNENESMIYILIIYFLLIIISFLLILVSKQKELLKLNSCVYKTV